MKNESSAVARLLESLCAQTRQPDEVVIVDGDSTDGTLAQLRAWEAAGRLPLRVLVEPDSSISRGRNVAIAAACGPIIACTDAGVQLDSSWLANLVKPFEGSGCTDLPSIVACGFFAPDPTTVFEIALGATTLPALSDINPERFLPSSRSVAFLRESWEVVGGYPEWLDYCEDLVFDFRLRAGGCRLAFTPDAVARFRPRSSLGAFFKQYFRYGRGDGKADLWRAKHAVRYATYLVGVPVLLWLMLTRGLLWALPLLVGAAVMFFTPYRRLVPALKGRSALEWVQAIVWVPIIRLAGDLAKMAGYPAGLLWRWRHRKQIPNWRQVPPALRQKTR